MKSAYEILADDAETLVARMSPTHLRCSTFRCLDHLWPRHGIVINTASSFLRVPIGIFRHQGRDIIHWPSFAYDHHFLAVDSDDIHIFNDADHLTVDHHSIAQVGVSLVHNSEDVMEDLPEEPITVMGLCSHKKILTGYFQNPSYHLPAKLIDWGCDFAVVMRGTPHLDVWEGRSGLRKTIGDTSLPTCGMLLMA